MTEKEWSSSTFLENKPWMLSFLDWFLYHFIGTLSLHHSRRWRSNYTEIWENELLIDTSWECSYWRAIPSILSHRAKKRWLKAIPILIESIGIVSVKRCCKFYKETTYPYPMNLKYWEKDSVSVRCRMGVNCLLNMEAAKWPDLFALKPAECGLQI